MCTGPCSCRWGSLSPLLKRLEALGYVTRPRSSVDERVLDIDLTEVGRDRCRQAELVPPAVVARLGLPLADLMDLHRALTRVIAAVDGDPES